jgi:hypothetical protein
LSEDAGATVGDNPSNNTVGGNKDWLAVNTTVTLLYHVALQLDKPKGQLVEIERAVMVGGITLNITCNDGLSDALGCT